MDINILYSKLYDRYYTLVSLGIEPKLLLSQRSVLSVERRNHRKYLEACPRYFNLSQYYEPVFITPVVTVPVCMTHVVTIPVLTSPLDWLA